MFRNGIIDKGRGVSESGQKKENQGKDTKKATKNLFELDQINKKQPYDYAQNEKKVNLLSRLSREAIDF
jgi:hypothetical protein